MLALAGQDLQNKNRERMLQAQAGPYRPAFHGLAFIACLLRTSSSSPSLTNAGKENYLNLSSIPSVLPTDGKRWLETGFEPPHGEGAHPDEPATHGDRVRAEFPTRA